MYLALDFPDLITSKNFLESNNLEGVPVKVGMELFYREGIKVIDYLKENNHSIFLDLKLFDIPTTVERAMRNLVKFEIDFVNVHALGGREMIKRAKEGLHANSASNHETKLLAVTVLTSMDNYVLNEELGLLGTVEDEVKRLAKLSEQSGADGVVCSVHEASVIKDICRPDFKTMTPGIRMQDTSNNDQKRVATPKYARNNGSDYIVIGRSITQAENPELAYEKALGEWSK